MNFLLPGIGAGLVSALLTAVIVKATPLAAVLYLLSPIPVLIVSLGWNHRSGLVAAAVGGLAIGIGISPLSGLGFAAVTGLPAWWLAYLALLGRPPENGAMEWYPIGRLLTWVAATAAVTVVAAGIISTRGDYNAFLGNAREIAQLFVNLQFPAGQPDSLDTETRTELVELFSRVTPFLSAQGFTVVLGLYLWAAAKVVAISKRLPRPWPSVPDLIMPRAATALLGACVLAMFLQLDNFLGVFIAALAGALFMAFALQGLAAVHDRTRGNPVRGLILGAVYVVLFVSQGLLMVALSLFGLADSIFGLRRRFRGKGRGPNVPPTLST
jgi:hypothetical protein